MGHDKLNILVFKTGSINLLSIIFIVILLLITGIDGLALALVVGVVVTRVIMSGVIVLLGGSKLLSSRGLCLGVKVLNLCLAKNAVTSLAAISQKERSSTYI